MTKPKKAAKPRRKKPVADDRLFPGKTDEQVVEALLKVPAKRKKK